MTAEELELLIAKPLCTDIDGDGVTSALTDGLLVIRYLFWFSNTNGALGSGAGRDASGSRLPGVYKP